MLISIITPSLNQASFLPDTINSVVTQKTDYEYIIIDGGSSDLSEKIIEQNAPYIKYWISEKDKGQANAINKGIIQAKGDVIAWINSDDIYLPGVFQKILKKFENPEVKWVTGDCEVINETGEKTGYYKTELPLNYFHWLNLLVRGYSCAFIQPSTFIRRSVIEETGLLNEELHYSFDHEYFLRIYRKYGPPEIIHEPLSGFRLHALSKTTTGSEKFKKENRRTGLFFSREQAFLKRIYLVAVYLRSLIING